MAYGTRGFVAGMTEAQYLAIFAQVKDKFLSAPGFLLHFGGPAENGWYVVEVWETQAQQEAWLRDVILPLMPPGAPAPENMPLPVVNVLTR